jgi:predicted nucleic acid-binding protein
VNFLLDTCLLSELYRKRPNKNVANWVAGIEEHRLFVSVLSLGEIQKGAAKLSEGERKQKIQTWLDSDLQKRFANRILPMDLEILLEWGRFCGESEKQGASLPVIDSLLAATAICRNLSVVTRNLSDFSRFPVKVFNPWQ